MKDANFFVMNKRERLKMQEELLKNPPPARKRRIEKLPTHSVTNVTIVHHSNELPVEEKKTVTQKVVDKVKKVFSKNSKKK